MTTKTFDQYELAGVNKGTIRIQYAKSRAIDAEAQD